MSLEGFRVLDEQLSRFRESGKTFSSRELAASYDYIRGFLIKGMVESPVDGAREYRDSNFYQLKALDAIMPHGDSGAAHRTFKLHQAA